MPEFKVLRAHWADKDGKRHRYEPGETRTIATITSEVEAQVRVNILESAEQAERIVAEAPVPSELPAPPINGRKSDKTD